MKQILKLLLKKLFFSVRYRNKNVKFIGLSDIALKSKFEGRNKIASGCSFSGYMGYGSYMGGQSKVYGIIGRFCSIAEKVSVIGATHPVNEFVSTHPTFYSILKQNGATYVQTQMFNEFKYADLVNKYHVVIGNDVWIGEGATIVGGITIGDGAIILANATVTKDVPPYAIIGGVPAKIIRYRFDENTITILLKFKWWNKSEHWLRNHAHMFLDVKDFLNEIKSGQMDTSN